MNRFILISLFINSTVLFADECPITIQLTNFEPKSCYYQYNEESCNDVCEASELDHDLQCFKTIDVPCSVKDIILDSVDAYEENLGVKWVHITQILKSKNIIDQLFPQGTVIHQDMYEKLYNFHTIQRKTEKNSKASLEFKKMMFRLRRIRKVENLTDGLNQTALFNRYSLALHLEKEVNDEYNNVISKVSSYPFYNSNEVENILSELELIKNNNLMFWNLLKNIDKKLVIESKYKKLNKRLNRLTNRINKLRVDKRQKFFQKVNIDFLEANISMFWCGEVSKEVCIQPLNQVDPPLFYNGVDQQLTYFEDKLFMIEGELNTYELSANYDGESSQNDEDPKINISGFLEEKLSNYMNNSTNNNLSYLEAAINVAFLSINRDGNTIFDELNNNSEAEFIGRVYTHPIENEPLWLCDDYLKTEPEIKSLSIKSVEVIKDLKRVMQEIRLQGHNQDLKLRIFQLVNEKNKLLKRLESLKAINNFKKDREINVFWRLNNDTTKFSEEIKNVDILYLSMNGVHWIPSFYNEIQALTGVKELGTMRGSFLPSGSGEISTMNTIKMKLEKSAYRACTNDDNEIKMIISVTNNQGKVNQYTLTANINNRNFQ
ncbi:hypothetical protein BS333_06530 [Vibrio azureus]|uniref:Uncharacterized protein n=1 Tax=Vibrio azureus NBRC 104587 TaxID=1219077 RepID=U3C8A3_9VIBR|nr:hypothetical protein [Vibrio azureus]AUI86065.1 hypothetical protein BS333_06530 [Vibrio azureus]GAD74678.1 hypothetical protein VAZ01S_013_00850 [Vibrio azureus NBRC 104587]